VCGAATACTAGATHSESTAASDPGTAVATGPASADAPPQAHDSIVSPVELPFAAYFQAGNTVAQAVVRSDEGPRSEWHDNSDAFIAACMKEAGFEYFPTPYTPPEPLTEETQPFPAHDTLPIPWLPASLEETMRVGYGVGAGVALGVAVNDPAIDGGLNPNDEYANSLSAEARKAYNFAFNGLNAETLTYDNPDSCVNRAWQKYPEPQGHNYDFAEVLEPMKDLAGAGTWIMDPEAGTVTHQGGNPTIFDDPQMSALLQEFGQCVAEQGLPPAGTGPLSPGPEALFWLAIETGADGSVLAEETMWTLPTESIPEDQKSLIGSAPEHDIAVADFRCRTQTDYVDRYLAILLRLESHFVATHQAELDEFMDAADRLLKELATAG
jgi:hypothetical protein